MTKTMAVATAYNITHDLIAMYLTEGNPVPEVLNLNQDDCDMIVEFLGDIMDTAQSCAQQLMETTTCHKLPKLPYQQGEHSTTRMKTTAT